MEGIDMVATAFGADDKVDLSGDTMTGTLTLAGGVPLIVPGATSGEVLTSDGSGNFSPQPGGATSAALTAETARAEAAEAAKQGLRTPTAVKTGTSYTAVAGDFAKIDSTAGAYTVTLPTAPPDKTVAGVKLVASATAVNAVTVTCGGSDKFNTSGGAATLTLKVLGQGVLLQYDTAATAWDVHGDDLPLGQLDARYANVFSPLAFGAKGDGTTDDTTPVQAAFAAASATGGVVDIGSKLFKTTSAIPLASYIRLRGAQYNNNNLGGITNTATDLFTLTGNVTCLTVEQCNLTATAGHVFNAGTANVSFLNVRSVFISQTSATHAIWIQSGGQYVDCEWGGNSSLACAATATVSPWQFTLPSGGGAFTDNLFGKMTAAAHGATVPFFSITTSSTTTGWNEDITFRDITFEVCTGGGISCIAIQDVIIDQCYNWDISAKRTDTGCGISGGTTVADAAAQTTDLGAAIQGAGIPAATRITAVTAGTGYTISNSATTGSGLTLIVGGPSAHFYSFTTSTLGYSCGDIVIRGGRPGNSTAGSGFSDIFADSSTSNILIDSYGSATEPPVISTPAIQTTLINPKVSGPTVAVMNQMPGLAATGITGATAASRYVGATASGAPTGSHPFLAGDFVIDQSGAVWICTAAGSPGTWSQVGGAAADYAPTGLTGATAASRYAGATTSGAPTGSHPFLTGDFVIDQTGVLWICTASGSPGTWVAASPAVPNVQWFNSTPGSYTWTKPSGAKTVYVFVVGAGGGGGSGRCDAAGTARCGGGGGGAGAAMPAWFVASDLTSTVAVTVAAGGSGGAAVNTTATSGNAGGAGGGSVFGTYLRAAGGGGGGAGTATTGLGGASSIGIAPGNSGAAASTTGLVGNGPTGSIGANGGGSGGGITSANVASNGGGSPITSLGASTNSAAAGVVDTTAPTAGAAITVQGDVGCGGGGGASSITTNAQAGASAAGYGGGGGGGGSVLFTAGNLTSSGAGGNGAQGYVLVVTYFQ
jgi:hypothetical protein